jgi:hypothetical protein
MGTNEYLLVGFTIMALYVNQTTNKITITGSFDSIQNQNGKYLGH